jgi:hypothetical protein
MFLFSYVNFVLNFSSLLVLMTICGYFLYSQVTNLSIRFCSPLIILQYI